MKSKIKGVEKWTDLVDLEEGVTLVLGPMDLAALILDTRDRTR